MKGFKVLTAIASAVTVSSLVAPPALASFGDFMLGVGATVGVGAIVNSVQRSNEANRNRPVSPKDEYFRGLQDGINGARYDNPRNSVDYDRGFQEGARRRNQR
ncbi:MAG: hypothetical protein VKJ27_01215 [Synechocystis sp.]|nr:hypothetical protein [Synechocystis sp.]